MCQFDKSKIVWEEKLHQGPSSAIYPYREDQDNNKWVIKCVSKDSFIGSLQFVGKVALGINLDHPNVLSVQSFSVEEKEEPKRYEVYIKLERMKKSLADIIAEYAASKDLLPEKQIIQWFYGLVCGLEYLHSKKISHTSINPSNILLDQENNVKLTDIGLAKNTSSAANENERSISSYWAPELVEKENRRLKDEDLFISDIWSLGRSMMKLCLPELMDIRGKLLFPQEIESEIQVRLVEIQTKYGEGLGSILASMLKYNPQERSRVSEIKKTLEYNYSDILVYLIYKI